MSMFWLEQQLRQSGNSADLARAAVIGAMLDDRGEDIPLPSAESSENDECSPIATDIGVLALRTGDAHLLSKSMDQIELESANLAKLDQLLTKLVDPYSALINRLTPPYSEPEKNMLGRVKKQSLYDTVRFTSQRSGVLPYDTNVELSYKSEKAQNIPTQVKAELLTMDGEVNLLIMLLNGQISDLAIIGNGVAQLKVTAGSEISGFIERLCNPELHEDLPNLSPIDVRQLALEFNLSSGRLSTDLKLYYRNVNGLFPTRNARLEYIYEPLEYIFKSSTNLDLEWWNSSFKGDELTPRQYSGLVMSALSLLPVVQVQ